MKLLTKKLAAAGTAFALILSTAPLMASTAAQAAPGLPETCTASIDKTSVDFAQGTHSGTVADNSGDGGVTLASTGGTSFPDNSLPGDWFTSPWNSGSSAVVSNGALKIDGLATGMSKFYTSGNTVEFDANFSGEVYEHAGFAKNFQDVDAAAFSTQGGGFWAYVYGAKVGLSTSFLGSMHHYKIEWTGNTFTFSIDNQVVSTQTAASTVPMRPMFSNISSNGVSLTVDNVGVSPYSNAGNFTSRIFDTGEYVEWKKMKWNASVPSDTTLSFKVRVGDSDTPDATWSSWKSIAASGADIDLGGRFAQYSADFTTTTGWKEPVIQDVSLGHTNQCDTMTIFDTTTQDFALGTPSGAIESQTGDGALTVGSTGGSSFPGSTLPGGWFSSPWHGGLTSEVSGGSLKLDGVAAGMNTWLDSGSALEFDATFTGETYEHAGYAVNFQNIQAAAFSTQDGGFWAYVYGEKVAVPTKYLGGAHRFRIEWTLNTFKFFVDGTLVATKSASSTVPMRPMFSDIGLNGQKMVIDNVGIFPYSYTGSFTSRVFDAGSSVAWEAVRWTASTPTGTSVAIKFRSGDTETPDDTWSAWKPVLSSGDKPGTTGRYAQYSAELSTTLGWVEPTLEDVSLFWPKPKLVPTTTTEAPTTTTTEVPLDPEVEEPVTHATFTSVEATDVNYGDAAVELRADITSNIDVDQGAVTFEVKDANGNVVGSSVDAVVDNGHAATSYLLPAGTKAGDYRVEALFSADSTFGASDASTAFAINKAQLTVKVDDKTRIYGAANPAFTASFAGFVGNDTAASLNGAITFSTSAVGTSAAGDYAVTASGIASNNYEISFQPGTLTIGRAQLTVKADDKETVYGTSAPMLTASFDGFVNGDSVAQLDGTLVLATDGDNGIGAHTIKASGLSSDRYEITFVDGTWNVTSAKVVVKVKDSRKTYGDDNPVFSLDVTGLALGDGLDGAPVFSTGANKSSVAGEYKVSVSGLSSPNYTVVFEDGTLTVDKAPLVVVANDASSVYGETAPKFSASAFGLKNNDTLATLDGELKLDSDGKDAGAHIINIGGVSSDRYDLMLIDGTWTITPAHVVVRVNDSVKTYGAPNPAFSVTTEGLIAGDALNGDRVYATSASNNSRAGSYEVSASGLSSPNYTVSFVPGTLTIKKAELVITADDKARNYGTSNPAFTASFSGLAGNDTAASLGAVSFSTNATASSPAGVYKITPSGISSDNYNIKFVDGKLTVGKSKLTVRADDKTSVYGAAVPTFTASVTGFVNGDSLAQLGGALKVESAGSAVGSYAIKTSGLTSDRYEISFVDGTWKVTPVAVSVVVNNTTKSYGSDNPAFSAVTTGLVGNDKLNGKIVFSTNATKSSGVGSYAVTASGLSSPNYTVGYTGGVLTVTKAALTVKADDKSKIVGAANPTLTATVSGFVNGETTSVLTKQPALSTTATTTSPVAIYPITASGAAAANYDITYVAGSLTVNLDPNNASEVCDIDGKWNNKGKGKFKVRLVCNDGKYRLKPGNWRIDRVFVNCDTLAPTGKSETIFNQRGGWNSGNNRLDWNDDVNGSDDEDICWKIVIVSKDGKVTHESKPVKIDGDDLTFDCKKRKTNFNLLALGSLLARLLGW